MAFNLNDFRSTVIRPARPNLYRVELSLPGTDLSTLQFTCEATSVPSKTNGSYAIFYQGRQIQYAGDTIFSPWQITVINEEENPVRGQFENWFELINGTFSGVRDGGFATSLDYKGIGDVYQETQTADTAAHYIIDGTFPTTLGPLELAWSQTDQYQTFQVTLALDYWYPAGLA